MLDRARFCAAGAATMIASCATGAAASLLPKSLRIGARLSLAEMLAAYSPARKGDLVQYELGFGATYDKQIGFGDEIAEAGRLLFVESQVGNGDHACNPNTLKKVYLKSGTFANVFTPYAAQTYITRSGNMLTRWGDGVGPAASSLLLLDAKALYDVRRPTVTAVDAEHVVVDGRTIATTRISAQYPAGGAGSLQTVQLWLSNAVPLGLVKMAGTATDLDPFHLSVYKFTRNFRTELAMTLRTVRALTPTGDAPIAE